MPANYDPLDPRSSLANSPEAESVISQLREAELEQVRVAEQQTAQPVPPVAVPGVPVIPGTDNAGAVPGVPGVIQENAPLPSLATDALSAARTQAAASTKPRQTEAYAVAGNLSAEIVISGAEVGKYIEYEPRLEEVLDKVQRDLVNMGRADDLVEARSNLDLKDELAIEIDRLALSHMMTMRTRGGDEKAYIIASVINEILGLGPIEPLWQDPSITEVIVNGPTDVYVERFGKLIKARGVRFRSTGHLLEVCQRILSPLNRKLDVKDPLADGRLPDGSRVNAVHYAIAPKGPLLTIRRFPQVNRSLVDLVDLGAMTEEMACTLAWLVKNKASSLVCGGTGTGKTTLLNALSAAIPRQERVVTIEDSLELRLHPESHVAAMEARPADAAGHNAVTIRSLVKNALRMRPDRIVVGEIRDQAALDMLQACNTGHEGSLSTVHANGPNEAVSRLAVMVAQGGEIPADKVDWLVGSALDLIIMIRRYKDGSRRVQGIYEVPESEPGQVLKTIPIWEWERTGEEPDGKLLGEYRKVGEFSEQLREKLGLDFEPLVSPDELRALAVQ